MQAHPAIRMAQRALSPSPRCTALSHLALCLAFLAFVSFAPAAATEEVHPEAAAPASHSSPDSDRGVPVIEEEVAAESHPKEGAAHGEEAEEGSHGGGVPEIPNAVQLLYEYFHEKALEEGTDPAEGVAGILQTLHKGPIKEPLPIVGTIPWENHVFAVFGGLVIIFLFWMGVRRLEVRPRSRWQALVESVVELFHNFVIGILGPHHGRRFAPYIATLFIFILVNNLMVLVPFLKAPTSSLVLTGSLALLTFVIVQATALIHLGPLGYLYHLMGEPKGLIMWLLMPLFLVLHVIGELARPVSLSLRLFGNVLGEDILLGAFLLMGVALAGTLGIHPPIPGFPLHFPFMFLVILTSTIQALVFALLSTIYILLVLPHDEHHEHGETLQDVVGEKGIPSAPAGTGEVSHA
jgi:F-type H+-transporting ATPase subunit a